MVPKSRHYRNVTKTIFTKSEKSQSSSWSERNARLNMVPNCPKWPRHGLNIAPVIQHSVGLSQDFSQILKHLKQVEANIQQKQQKLGPFMAQTQTPHGQPNCLFLNLNDCVQGCSMPDSKVLASIFTDIFNSLTHSLSDSLTQ